MAPPPQDTTIAKAIQFATEATSNDTAYQLLAVDGDDKNASIKKALAIEFYKEAVKILLFLKTGEKQIKGYMGRIDELESTYRKGGSKRRKRKRRKTKKPNKTKRRKKPKKTKRRKKTKKPKKTKSRR